VTSYIWKNDKLFKTKTIDYEQDLSNMRWTVDEERDLDFIREVYKRLYRKEKIFLMKDILNLLKKYPDLIKINQSIKRDQGYSKSLLEKKQ
jgi:spore coat polysaccharide biosynthesis protein SpsF (cytidylyltransferase family)